MNDEVIRLVLDLANNAKDTQELIDKLQGLNKAGQSVADTYEVIGESWRRIRD